MNQQDFLTLEEAAKGLGKSVQTVRRMIKRGELPAKRVKSPQGFQYVVDREDVFPNARDTSKSQPVEPEVKEEMFFNSPIQKPIPPLDVEQKPSAPIQLPILTSQSDLEPLLENDFYTLDRNLPDYAKIIEMQHKEKMMLIHILERLQGELRLEREPRSLLERIWRRFF
ncbi:MAG: hypothetical protein UY05_C0013G0004 [Candidatus Peregrinibacteria bacterium GW2011_GWA2_47_7]|nr:MAG: hypothetical protein UY05_C0013G0004 [Candidatus Peregrinibacteria bacterium GW2011_GWA2_47_7]